MPPPGAPPPGAPGQPYQVGAAPAAPEKKSALTKVLVIGCVVLLLIGLVVGGVTCYFGIQMSDELAEGFQEGLQEAIDEGMGEQMDAAE